MAKNEANENVKPIILTDKETGDTYTLEFNRASVMFAERRGFDIDDVGKYQMTKIPELFFYAFRMHHPNLSREKTDHIYFDKLGGLSAGALERLVQLYAQPYKALTNDDEDADNGEAKNARMTVEL